MHSIWMRPAPGPSTDRVKSVLPDYGIEIPAPIFVCLNDCQNLTYFFTNINIGHIRISLSVWNDLRENLRNDVSL
jgi:hypothetical protein